MTVPWRQIALEPECWSHKDAAVLRLFCKRVAATYRIERASGYPADVFALRQYLSARSATYFFRISSSVDRALTDPLFKVCNKRNTDRWRSVISTHLIGGELAANIRLIETLQLERLLIEHATSVSAFRFEGES